MEFTQNDSGKHDIIYIIIMLTKQGTNTIHAGIPTKYQKYPSTTIPKQPIFLAEANPSPWGVYRI